MKTVTIKHASEAGQQIRGFRAWQDFAKANFPWAETADRRDGEFRANVKVRSFGDCRLSMIKADDYRVVRTEHGVRRANAECLKVMWLQHGSMAVEQDGRSGRLVPGIIPQPSERGSCSSDPLSAGRSGLPSLPSGDMQQYIC
jgi:hypothetical protein